MTKFPPKLITGVGSVKHEDDEKERSSSDVVPIPHDLELAIMTRIPAKSLMKFKCLSTTWSSIIRSQRFVNSYYAMSTRMRSSFLIAFSNGARAERNNMGFFIFSSSSHHEEGSDSFIANLDMTIPSLRLYRGSNCASVHGLLGFTNYGPFIVCNPSTKKVTRLQCIGERTYLGYDHVDDQFKALEMTSLPYRTPDPVVHEVLTFGREGGGGARKEVTTSTYFTATKHICINGFVYFGAWTPKREQNPVIVCFDVRHERMSFITAPQDVLVWEWDSILIEYKGKLASIARHPYAPLDRFALWILEDPEKQYWSKQSFELEFSFGQGKDVFSPGANKAGDIIFAPKYLSHDVEPFYIFCYNVEKKCMRRVRIHGIADTQEFRSHYGLAGECWVYISPEHIESIASL